MTIEQTSLQSLIAEGNYSEAFKIAKQELNLTEAGTPEREAIIALFDIARDDHIAAREVSIAKMIIHWQLCAAEPGSQQQSSIIASMNPVHDSKITRPRRVLI